MYMFRYAVYCCSVFLFLLRSVFGLGNPYCWSTGFSYDTCCDVEKYGPAGNIHCWDSQFTYEHCCLNKVESRSYETGWIFKESSVIRDRQNALESRSILSRCQTDWGWALNRQWGAPTGAFSEYCGVPLRHIGSGWDGQRGGNYRGCNVTGGRFFLVQLDFQAHQVHSMHFGFCAPQICSAEEVASDLVPTYIMYVADARRLLMTGVSVRVWEWPHFLDSMYVSDLQDTTLRERIDQVSFQIHSVFLCIASLVVLATLFDLSSDIVLQSQVCNGAQDQHRVPSFSVLKGLAAFGQHFVHAFSVNRACKELGSPSRGITVDFLRSLATLFIVSVHLEAAQNRSLDGAQEGGSLFRISLCFRCVIIMTVLALHLVLDGESNAKDCTLSLQKVFGRCSIKLARRFLRHLPLIMLSTWWDKIGLRFSFPNQPLNYVDGTQSVVRGVALEWNQWDNDCMQSYWTCAFRFHTMNWQVRDANERVLLCFGLLILRCAGLSRVVHGILYVWAVVYYGIKEYGPESEDRVEWEKWHGDETYHLFRRFEYPAFLGLFLVAENLIAAVPQRFVTKRIGLLLAVATWCWSAWINQNDPAQWCLARNVKKCLGDIPFVLGLCFLLRTGVPGTQFLSTQTENDMTQGGDTGMIKALFFTVTVISRLSFCILVVEEPFRAFLLRGSSHGGVPLARVLRADPMWERIILGPGLLLAHGVLAFFLFILIQRPAEVFLKPLLELPLVEGLLHGLLPIYVAFLAYHWRYS